jgi:hypothetical protein
MYSLDKVTWSECGVEAAYVDSQGCYLTRTKYILFFLGLFIFEISHLKSKCTVWTKSFGQNAVLKRHMLTRRDVI